MRMYENCAICNKRFENTDGLGICCSDKCWNEYDQMEEVGDMDE